MIEIVLNKSLDASQKLDSKKERRNHTNECALIERTPSVIIDLNACSSFFFSWYDCRMSIIPTKSDNCWPLSFRAGMPPILNENINSINLLTSFDSYWARNSSGRLWTSNSAWILSIGVEYNKRLGWPEIASKRSIRCFWQIKTLQKYLCLCHWPLFDSRNETTKKWK